LDARPLKHPTTKQPLALSASKRALALALALEWETLTTAAQATRTHYIPLTSLAARALDVLAADEAGLSGMRSGIVDVMMRYLATDTLLCWAPEASVFDATDTSEAARREGSGALRDMQREAAKPIIAYLTTNIWPGVELNPILDESSILPVEQPEMTRQVIRGWLSGLPAWELAGLERAVLALKSLVVGVRLIADWSGHFSALRGGEVHGGQRFGVRDAEEACTLEVRWQTGRWGEVDDTHDVEKEDLRRQLGSAVLLVQ
jgi:ATP synthase F1 complex assembly factor 2